MFGAPARDTVSGVQVLSGYAQDQISLGGVIDIVAGLRYDRFEINGTDRIGTAP